jgi:xylulokinase
MAKTLGIDVSTQSVTAIVYDLAAGSVECSESVHYGSELPGYGAASGFVRGSHAGEVLANPLMWLEALDLCLAKLGQRCKLGQIVAISGAGQQHGTVYLNAKGCAAMRQLRIPHIDMAGGFSRDLSPIWMDQSTGPQCRAIESAMGGALEVCRRTGSIAIERFSGPQIRRFAETQPEAYAATERIHLVSSFIASILTGSDAPIDRGDGAGMNLLNLDTWDWDPDLMKATAEHLEDRLPAVAPSATLLGKVAGWLVARHGFSPDTEVVAFTGDNPSSLVGMGDCLPRERLISLGTSDTLFGRQEVRTTDPRGFGHLFGHPLGGTMALQCFVNGSLAREQVREALGIDWDAFSAAIEATPAGNSGYYLLPFFEPEISPRLSTAGVRLVGSVDSDWKAMAASARACVEGQMLNMRLQSSWIGPDPEHLYLTGGASRNNAIAQIAANVFNAPVYRIASTDSVALGGAGRAGLACGEMDLATERRRLQESMGPPLQPQPGSVGIYRDALEAVHEALER